MKLYTQQNIEKDYRFHWLTIKMNSFYLKLLKSIVLEFDLCDHEQIKNIQLELNFSRN